VKNANDAPELSTPPADQTATENSPFSYLLPATTFEDIDVGDSLRYDAALTDGSGLPGWLSFDDATGAFSGTPGSGDAGSLVIRITATDLAGATAETVFTLNVGAASVNNGSDGNDLLKGDAVNNSLFGLGGNDNLYGYGGDDFLDGGNGIDRTKYRYSAFAVAVRLATGAVSGGDAEGDSLLAIENVFGSAFDDHLAGNDVFVFDTVLSATTNRDTITDFVAGEDRMLLSRAVFTALAEESVLSTKLFAVNGAGSAMDDNDYILYNTSSGALLYDADGSGEGAAVQFAALTNKPEISANDFLVAA
jgi:Ca2+-binding RTX toxin-like protein